MARWHSCNVLQPGAETYRLWQFAPAGGKFARQREETRLPTETLPAPLVAKDWQTLFQPRLNIAWLPADKVFLRVLQLPKVDPAETRSMLDLQLEKLSPLPVNQVVWGFETLLCPGGEMQTAIVVIAAQAQVEEFLGKLEGRGYLADRLEVPFLDQLRAAQVTRDGAWVYAGVGEDPHSCLVAWWVGGILRNLCLVHLPPEGARAAVFQEQLAQMTWAGELEGWLTAPPKFHLVADPETAAAWQALFGEEEAVLVERPLPAAELAGLTARRVAGASPDTNLLPTEYAARYRQRFIDQLWMRGLGAVLTVYVLVTAFYLGWVQVAKWRSSRAEAELARVGVTYTNTIQVRDRLRVLQDQLDLQFAALDSWKAVADFLPAELTVNNLNFDRGRKVLIFGSASSEDVSRVQDFNDSLRKVMVRNHPLFSNVEAPKSSTMPGAQQINWNFSCDLRRTDTP